MIGETFFEKTWTMSKISLTLLDRLANKKILVIGDIMLDQYWWGSVTRISPEAPVPVVRLERTSTNVGGAANVASNIAALGCTPVLIGCIGDDPHGRELTSNLKMCGVDSTSLAVVSAMQTIVKTRIIAGGQHIARVDQEQSNSDFRNAGEELRRSVDANISEVAAIVLSDYAKGTLSVELIDKAIQAAAALDIPVIVDPKGQEFVKYSGASLITPNRREAATACGLDPGVKNVTESAGRMLRGKLPSTSILITEGENGMTLFTGEEAPFHTDSAAREVFDVTGAGDTVVAALAVALTNGISLRESVEFANTAAGYAVQRVGTTIVSLDMIRGQLEA